MSTSLERIKRYRLLAEEIRTAADDMNDGEGRRTLVRIADSYDLMADELESREKRVRKSSTGSE